MILQILCNIFEIFRNLILKIFEIIFKNFDYTLGNFWKYFSKFSEIIWKNQFWICSIDFNKSDSKILNLFCKN